MTAALLGTLIGFVCALAAGHRRARAASTGRIRLLACAYGTDRVGSDELAATVSGLHALMRADAWRRVAGRGRTVGLEIHLARRPDGSPLAWLAVCCAADQRAHLEAVLRGAYPNLSLTPIGASFDELRHVVRLRRRWAIEPAGFGVAGPDRPPVERVLRAAAAGVGATVVQVVLCPTPRWRAWRRRGATDPGSEEPSRPQIAGPSFTASIRVLGACRADCQVVAAALIAGDGRGALTYRATMGRSRGGGARLRRRLAVAAADRGTAAGLGGRWPVTEVGLLWQLPSPSFSAVPLIRRSLPVAPAPPGITRAALGNGLLSDDHGPVTIAVELRRQNLAIVGTVDQGKSSALVCGAREDLGRSDCAVIVMDPKGDAAEAVLSVVPADRTCTYLDLARPACGFNPLGVDAPIDAIADNVVAALRQLFGDGEIRGSSDRYLRNAVIAALACDRRATLWDVARLLAVGEQGETARARAGLRLAELPAYAEVAWFLADELPTQLAQARATTTAKLDAPTNKLARVLNSASIKRVLLHPTLTIDLDRVIARHEVLIVRGALGELGAGNVSVLMQLLLGMLDACLARRQDRLSGEPAGSIALKVDEAPLVINAAFAQTLALKRSAGLETTACWQTDSQWEPELRDQLDALFGHRILFATASADDARGAAALLMAEFSDQVRAGDSAGTPLASPDVRLHLPRHAAIVSWSSVGGRERPFIARTMPLRIDADRMRLHLERQRARGGIVSAEVPQPPQLVAFVSPPEAPAPPSPGPQSGHETPQSPRSDDGALPASLVELSALASAERVRWLPVRPSRPGAIDTRELEMLEWIAAARCALTSQIHRRFHCNAALTTTQRRLKALADRGLIARFQLHRSDGGGAPMCCVATAAGLQRIGSRTREAVTLDEETLPGLLDDVRTVGWLLAFEAAASGLVRSVFGPGRVRIAPPADAAPSGLRLGPGLRARDFDLTDPLTQTSAPVERFAAVRPDAAIELGCVGLMPITDLLVVRLGARPVEALAHYDHLVSGWWRAVPRYARLRRPPLVVVLCDHEAATMRAVARADVLLTSCLARLGTPPGEWERPGREGIWFVAESDAHLGVLDGWRVGRAAPRLDPSASVEPLRGPIVVAAGAPAAPPARWR